MDLYYGSLVQELGIDLRLVGKKASLHPAFCPRLRRSCAERRHDYRYLRANSVHLCQPPHQVDRYAPRLPVWSVHLRITSSNVSSVHAPANSSPPGPLYGHVCALIWATSPADPYDNLFILRQEALEHAQKVVVIGYLGAAVASSLISTKLLNAAVRLENVKTLIAIPAFLITMCYVLVQISK